MLVSYIRVTSQINCGDVTILTQKRLSLATTAKSAIDNCFGGIECPGHQIACKKYNNTFVTVNNDFLGHSWCDLPMIFTRDFVTRENDWQIASLVTQKSLFTVTHALFFIYCIVSYCFVLYCITSTFVVVYSPYYFFIYLEIRYHVHVWHVVKFILLKFSQTQYIVLRLISNVFKSYMVYSVRIVLPWGSVW